MIELPGLRSGQRGVVASIRLCESSGKRLADIGFIPGARVEMLRVGDPCIVRLDDSRVGLGRDYQRAILLDLA